MTVLIMLMEHWTNTQNDVYERDKKTIKKNTKQRNAILDSISEIVFLSGVCYGCFLALCLAYKYYINWYLVPVHMNNS